MFNVQQLAFIENKMHNIIVAQHKLIKESGYTPTIEYTVDLASSILSLAHLRREEINNEKEELLHARL